MPSSHVPSSSTSSFSKVSSPSVPSSFHVPVAHSQVPSIVSHSCTNNVPNTFELWHNRLGHASKHVVSHIFQHCKIPFSNKMTVKLCKACCLGKANRFSPLPSPNTYSFPFELVCITYGDLPQYFLLKVIDIILLLLMPFHVSLRFVFLKPNQKHFLLFFTLRLQLSYNLAIQLSLSNLIKGR